MLFSVVFPALLLCAAAGLDYGRLVTASAALQQAVDEGALMGARELVVANLTDQEISSHVQSSVYAAAYMLHPGVQVASYVDNKVAVVASAWVDYPLIFGGLFGFSSQKLTRRARATLRGDTQLCVLTLDGTASQSFSLTGSARLVAPQCSAYANSTSSNGLSSTGSAFAQSSRTCVVGGYAGNSANFAPLPKTGCPARPDPLSGVVPPTADLTNCTKNLTINANTTLSPGTYCGGITVNGTASVTLSPGVYIINGGDFHLFASSQLSGQNAAIYFNGASGTFKADPKTTLSMSAPKTGPLAGFLIYQDKTANAGQDFHISSAQADNMLGTIYLPQGKLTVDSPGKVAQLSAYTVIVAQQLVINGSASMTLNAMYTSSDVPVPRGVGPSGSTISLSD